MTELFSRNGCSTSSENDEWDDTELIKAYDIAISNSKEKIKERLNSQNEHKNERQNSRITVTIGAPCRAVYDVDNIEYEATIVSIENENEVIVQYIGYGNTQTVPIIDLRPSFGLKARQVQEQTANELQDIDVEVEDTVPPKRSSQESRNLSGKMSRLSQESRNESPKIPRLSAPPMAEMNMFGEMSFPPPPPLPPSFAKNMKPEEHEALNAMLMSWYMSGYYTGYYQGLKKSEK